MLRIHYQPYVSETGLHHSPIAMTDQACEEAYATMLYRYQETKGRDQDWCVSSENFYNRIRVGIIDGEIDHLDVEFIYDGQALTVNQYGAVVNWPHGFLDYNIQLVERILLGSFRVRQNERRSQRQLSDPLPYTSPEAVRIYVTNVLHDQTGEQIIHTRTVDDQGVITMRFYVAPASGVLFDPTIEPLYTWSSQGVVDKL